MTNEELKKEAQIIKEKYVPTLHDDYDSKMIDAMVEFYEQMQLKNNCIKSDVIICKCSTEEYMEGKEREDGLWYCGKCNKPY